MTVNWNSLDYLCDMLDVTRAMSPPDTRIIVVDNASSDGSREYLADRSDVESILLPVNVGHGVGLDLATATVDTEFLAVLDVDAFPISKDWLGVSMKALEDGAKVAGAHLHRNFVHPCFLVTRTSMLHEYDLTFRPFGSLTHLDTEAPLFLDVAEAMCQRAIVKFGGSQALHFFEITSTRGPGRAGAVFGGLVYHNMYATQGAHRTGASSLWLQALDEHHPDLPVGSRREPRCEERG